MGAVSYVELAQLLSGGGVLAFALIVYVAMRDIRRELAQNGKRVGELATAIQALLERDNLEARVRSAIKEEISGVHEAASDEPTPPTPPPKKRAPSPVVVVRRSRPGDKEGA